MTQTITTAPHGSTIDGAYHRLQAAIAQRIQENREPLFTTTANPETLWELYLGWYPAGMRQYYTCHCCRHFVQRYGGLVMIDATGTATPFLWTAIGEFDRVASHLAEIVRRSRVNGVFLSESPVWGTPQNVAKKTGVTWTHLHGVGVRAYGDKAGPLMAERKEDVGVLNRAIDDYSLAAVQEAVRVLTSGALTRSEKAEGIATWFLDLHLAIAANPRARHNLVWRAIASAPPGFAHVRNTVLSTLLDDIVSGKSFDEVSRRWAEKMHPLQYQRPTAAPRAGQIAAAERLVQELGLERSLQRRFATLADVQVKLWEPSVAVPAADAPKGGVFDVLKTDTESVRQLELPVQKITWEKFARTVLPTARTIEVPVQARDGFYGLVTATDPDAPAILQWDGLEGHPRNPVSWYFYHQGSLASQWGLTSGWHPVAAVFRAPFTWQEPILFAHHAPHVFFAIAAAQDSEESGLALFPENLRAELREARAVIAAYSNKTQLTGREQGNANGLAFNGQDRLRVRVTSAMGAALYDLDRWE